MTDWQRRIAPLVRAVEKQYDALKYRLYYALGGPGPIKIQPYRGYGTRNELHLKGRVLEDRGVTPAGKTDSWWENLVNMYKRLQSREVPHARLAARFQDVEREITADEEGMFEVTIEPSRPISGREMWQQVDLELVEPVSKRQEGPVQATGRVLIPPSDAPFGVISDIDDTVIQSDVGNFLRMISTVLLSNARTRLPLPGVAAFYRALHAGPDGRARSPMFYVSNGLWNLYDMLEEFFRLNRIPGGPVLLLRNWGVYRDELLPTRQQGHKLEVISPILDLYSGLPFILIGDSSEADPEIYHSVVHQYGDRILAVYIRNVDWDPERSTAIHALAEEILEAGSELVLADDSLSMARHAARRGWVQEESLRAIETEQSREMARAQPADGRSGLGEEGEVVKLEEDLEKGDIRSTVHEREDDDVPTVVVESEEDVGS
jgi:phosphatidate phosphatase APP1